MATNTTILALDLGTCTGWALQPRAGGPVTSGTQSFKPGRYEGGGMRYLRFRGWLNSLRASVEVHAVYFEEVRNHKGVDAAHIYGGLLAHLTAWCEQNKIPYQGVPVGTIKKSWTGSGNAGKAAMVEAARSRGFQPVDDNEADALAILHYALALDENAVEVAT